MKESPLPRISEPCGKASVCMSRMLSTNPCTLSLYFPGMSRTTGPCLQFLGLAPLRSANCMMFSLVRCASLTGTASSLAFPRHQQNHRSCGCATRTNPRVVDVVVRQNLELRRPVRDSDRNRRNSVRHERLNSDDSVTDLDARNRNVPDDCTKNSL